MNPPKEFSLSMKVFLLFAIGLFTFALIKTTTSTTAQSAQSKRLLDDRVPGHLPIKIKIKKEKEEGFQDLKNEHWARDFELEVKNVGKQPIYALSLVWMLTEVKMPDGNPYGSTFLYGRSEFITVPGERPKPDDVPIQPGETYVFKLSNSSVEGWESWAKDNQLPPLKSVQIFFNFVCFGDGTGWESPDGRPFDRKKPLAFSSPNKGDPGSCEQGSRQRKLASPFGFFLRPASFGPANFLLEASPAKDLNVSPDICCPGTSCSKIKRRFGRCYCSTLEFPTLDDKEFSVTTSCTDPAGQCGTTVPVTEQCNYPGVDFKLFCTQSLFVACGSSFPTPSPTPSEGPSPEPTCDPAKRPNSQNCECLVGPSGTTADWRCFCFGGLAADRIQYPQNGCPANMTNNGSECCVCLNPPICDPNTEYLSKVDCTCHPLGNGPTPTPTPTPEPTPPNDVSGCQSWGWFWNFQSPGCFPQEQTCAGHCSPYWPLESGGCDSPIDYCAFQWGCPFGFTDGGVGCCCGATPVLIDVLGDGFTLTDAYTGVFFDMGADGHKEPIAWTVAQSDDAFLALDRNGNGVIDSGKEMFGNFTDQPHATTGRNGFVALAEFDRPENGGNGDARIDAADAVFVKLLLWQDLNHNGFSEQFELRPLKVLGLATIELNYKNSKKSDAHGNQFGYRAKVKDTHGAQLNRWAWDVILKVNPPPRN